MSASGTLTQDRRIGRLTTGLGKDALLLTGMSAIERLSESYTVTVDAFSVEPVSLHEILGTAVGVAFESGGDLHTNRDFAGVLWEYNELGQDKRGWNYRLVLRPTTEFMTLNRRNRIFQNTSVKDIVTSLLVGTVAPQLNGTYNPVEYCVQYQESDFDFVSRLMEFEGIYYYYTHEGTQSTITLLDERNTHPDMEPSEVRVEAVASRRPDAPIWSVTERRGLAPVKVTVADFDFEMPESDLTRSGTAPKPAGEPTKRSKTSGGGGGDWASSAEIYDYPGKVVQATGEENVSRKPEAFGTSERYSELWLNAQRRRMARSFAEGALFSAKIGHRLKLNFENGTSGTYVIIGTNHDYTAPPYDAGEGEETFTCSMELMPESDQYRPAQVTPRPRILGPQTAFVTGPAGEEIYTDKYGRIKVQFHWDREGKKNDKSSCFIRVMQATAGQTWGAFHVPRIGQEVVVEFMDGDPDRPIVTGAVYNANNMPPTSLPANHTHSGYRSRSSKGGVGFNHYWFEDKKGAEVVWFRAQRDYKAHIVDKDEERQYDSGNRTTTFLKGNDVYKVNSGYRQETIEGNDSKTILSGDLTDIVKKGDEIHTVEEGDRTTTIGKGDETLEVSTGNRTTTIKKGDDALEVSMGNRATEVKMGNDDHKVSMGNISVKAALGKISMEAMQSIELKVGGSSITIDQIGVTIKGAVKVELKGVMIQSSADAMQMIKGGLVMIN